MKPRSSPPDDLLERATQALRETTAAPNPRSGLTRARMLEAAQRRGRGRRSLRVVLALAALSAGGTALARAGNVWPTIVQVLAPSLSPAPAPNAAAPRAERRRKPKSARAELAERAAEPTPTATPTPTPAAVEAAGAAEPAPPVSGGELRAPHPPGAPSRPAPSPPRRTRRAEPGRMPAAEAPPASPSSAEPIELALFRRAERLHLLQDPRALRAWNDYLRVAGDGVLAPEARYNRALCLLRLSRVVEARRALEPFARGEFGSFRRAEAAALLGALSNAEPAR